MNDSDELEIVVSGYSNNHDNLFVLNHNGQVIDNISIEEKNKSGFAIADLNGNGYDDIVFGTDDNNLFLVYDDGTIGFTYLTEDKIRSAPLIVDYNEEKYIIVGSKDSNLYSIDSSGELHFHAPQYYLYGVPISITIGLIFLSYFGARFGLENRKRTDALNKMELILAKEHELKIIGVQAAAAAHSLSTPLSTIKLVAKELEKEMGDNKKYAKDIKLLTSQSTRCGEILKKLSMAPVKKDDFFENVRLEDLLHEIVNSFKEISDKNFIVKSIENKNDPIVKRKAELTYGLRNFIGNASKFSSSLIEIEIYSNKDITQIKICDDGPGYPDDIINFLGEPYIHSKNKIIDSKSGMGLGVFIGKTLLERLKANVYFGKCPNNKGAMVTINWETKNLIST